MKTEPMAEIDTTPGVEYRFLLLNRQVDYERIGTDLFSI